MKRVRELKRLEIKRLLIKWLMICATVVFCLLFVCSLRGIAYPGINCRASLDINGEIIKDHKVRIYQRSDLLAWLPFTMILKRTGCSVQWITDETAEITMNGQSYILTGSKLYKRGEETNLIVSGPGQDVYEYRFENQELYLDSKVLQATLETLGIFIELEINPEERIITITGSTGDGAA